MASPQERPARRPLFDFGGANKQLVLWAAALNFFLLASYYILRPVRDEIFASYVGIRANLFLHTFLATVFVAGSFAALTRAVSRGRLVAGTLFFLALNLIAFQIWLPSTQSASVTPPFIERAFYVWVTIFGLVGVSIIWSLITDSFKSSQAKGVFGIFFFGSTLGANLASLFVMGTATTLERNGLLATAAGLAALAAFCALRIGGLSPHQRLQVDPSTEPLTGKLRAGLSAIATSPQLRRICLYLATYTFGSTLLYYLKGDMIREEFVDRDSRTAFYAELNLYVGLACLIPQLFLTNRTIGRLGLGGTLMILPVLSAIGFALLALMPSFTLIVAFEIARRSLNFIFAKPAREVLFTGVTTQDRFQAKPMIDTVWYRGTDWLAAELLKTLELVPAANAWLGVPAALAGALLGRRLGQAHDETLDEDPPGGPAS